MRDPTVHKHRAKDRQENLRAFVTIQKRGQPRWGKCPVQNECLAVEDLQREYSEI
jgi:hypothetical protein